MVTRSIVLVACLVAAVGCTRQVAPEPGTAAQPDRDADEQAIRDLLTRYVDIVNGAEFAAASRQARVEMLRPFYRPDASYPQGEMPLFFGALSEPVSRGVEAHLENTDLNFAWLFGQKMTYGVRIEETQIEVGDNLGVALSMTTSGYQSADGQASYVSPGRATLVFTRMSDRWLISHEHLELYNPNAPGVLSKDQLRAQVERLAQ